MSTILVQLLFYFGSTDKLHKVDDYASRELPHSYVL